jgi:hypothetical protein
VLVEPGVAAGVPGRDARSAWRILATVRPDDGIATAWAAAGAAVRLPSKGSELGLVVVEYEQRVGVLGAGEHPGKVPVCPPAGEYDAMDLHPPIRPHGGVIP